MPGVRTAVHMWQVWCGPCTWMLLYRVVGSGGSAVDLCRSSPALQPVAVCRDAFSSLMAVSLFQAPGATTCTAIRTPCPVDTVEEG